MPTSGHITAGELARVCAHYDLGEVTAARKLKRGAKAAPKVVLESSTGRFLLKRRAPGRDAPATVAIAHEVQLYLARRAFPTPTLLGTRRDNNSMLQLDGRVYEVFTFVQGRPFDRSIAQTEQAGRTLALLHELLRDLRPSWQPAIGAYHAAAAVPERLAAISQRTPDTHLQQMTRDLRALYTLAANEASRFASDWRPDQLIHADWHPGNLIFAPDPSGRVLGVLDFDSVRIAPPVVDLGNAALQFSITRGPFSHVHAGGDAPDTEHNANEIDLNRLTAFTRGYHSQQRQLLRRGEIEALPWLMVEALITETAVTVAATGSFGKVDASDMVRMVARKARWIRDHAHELTSAASARP